MKLPRDMDAPELIKALQHLGYRVVRQSGSDIRLQSNQPGLTPSPFPIIRR